MANGNADIVFEDAERAIRQMAACELSHSAKAVKQLLVFAHAVDTNEKALIRLIIKQGRMIKKLNKYCNTLTRVLTRKQKRQVMKWLQEEDNI